MADVTQADRLLFIRLFGGPPSQDIRRHQEDLLEIVKHRLASQPEAGEGEKLPRGPVEPVKMPPYRYQAPDYGGGSTSATPPAQPAADLVESLAMEIGDYAHENDQLRKAAALQRPALPSREDVAVHLGQAFPTYSYDERWNIAGVILTMFGEG